MKKFLLVSLALFLLLIGLLTYRYHTDRFFMRQWSVFNGVGHSMEPTLQSGQSVKVYKTDYRIGDIVTFHCSKPECLKWGNDFTTDGEFAKRLVQVREDGAWWVDGDNKTNSFDSDYFGWILPSEISDVWVVKL